MPHVTFIHGLANKPEARKLHEIWLRALAKGDQPLDLSDEGVTSRLVYWADVLYEKPDPDVAAHESTHESRAEEVDAGGNAAVPVAASDRERAFLDAMRANFTTLDDREIAAAEARELAGDAPPVGSEAPEATSLERIPLPWSLKKRIMAAQLRDAHHYLFNVEFSPRPGTSYRVQDEIRRRFVSAIAEVKTDRHVVVSHSMGTIIAYDCLKRVADCPRIDGLITLGSPLGIDELQDCLAPEWSRSDGFPGERLGGRWVNVFDRLDVVCGADPKIANDFKAGGEEKIADVGVSNHGWWRHSLVKYFAQPALRDALRELLDL